MEAKHLRFVYPRTKLIDALSLTIWDTTSRNFSQTIEFNYLIYIYSSSSTYLLLTLFINRCKQPTAITFKLHSEGTNHGNYL